MISQQNGSLAYRMRLHLDAIDLDMKAELRGFGGSPSRGDAELDAEEGSVDGLYVSGYSAQLLPLFDVGIFVVDLDVVCIWVFHQGNTVAEDLGGDARLVREDCHCRIDN